MVKLLIDYNADLNKFGKHTTIITGDGRTATEFTPLHLAVEADELNFVNDISGVNSQGFYEGDRFSAVTIHEAESNLVNVATNIYTQRYTKIHKIYKKH